MIRSDAETRRVQRYYNKVASQYDNRLTGFLENLLFGDGRSWVCSQARGEVLAMKHSAISRRL